MKLSRLDFQIAEVHFLSLAIEVGFICLIIIVEMVKVYLKCWRESALSLLCARIGQRKAEMLLGVLPRWGLLL